MNKKEPTPILEPTTTQKLLELRGKIRVLELDIADINDKISIINQEIGAIQRRCLHTNKVETENLHFELWVSCNDCGANLDRIL